MSGLLEPSEVGADGSRPPSFASWIAGELLANPRLAKSLSVLLEYPDRWIRRRVERVEIDHLELARSYTSLDVRLDHDALEGLLIDGGQRLLLPVGYAQKGGRLTGFDLAADGKASSLLSRPENVELSAHVLRQLLVEDGCTAIPDLDVLRRFCDAPPTSPLPAALEGHASAWISVFSERYVLYASVPSSSGDHQRQIKLAQTMELVGEPITSASGGDTTLGEMSGDLVMDLRIDDLGFGARHHVDLLTADEVSVVAARIVASGGPGGEGQTPVIAGRGTVGSRIVIDGEGDVWRHSRVAVQVVLRAQRRVFVREAFPLGLMMWLATLGALVPWVLGPAEVPAGYASLLIAPAVLAFALAMRHYDAEITRAAVRKHQQAVTTQTFVLLVAIATLAVFRFNLGLPDPLGPTVSVVAKGVVASGMLLFSGAACWSLVSAWMRAPGR